MGEVNTTRVTRELNIFHQQVLYSECTAIYVTAVDDKNYSLNMEVDLQIFGLHVT